MYELIKRRLTGEYVIRKESKDTSKVDVFKTYSQAEAQRKLCLLRATSRYSS